MLEMKSITCHVLLLSIVRFLHKILLYAAITCLNEKYSLRSITFGVWLSIGELVFQYQGQWQP